MHHLLTPTHHFHKMVCTTSPDCRGWRGISWHCMPVAKPCSSTQRCQSSGRAAQVRKYSVMFPQSLSRDYSAQWWCRHWGVTEPKAPWGLQGLSASNQDLAWLYKSSLIIHVIRVLSMTEIFQQLIDSFTSCTPRDSAKACAKAWLYKLWKAATLSMLGEMHFCSAVFLRHLIAVFTKMYHLI